MNGRLLFLSAIAGLGCSAPAPTAKGAVQHIGENSSLEAVIQLNAFNVRV